MASKVGPEHLRDFERRRSLRFVLPRQEDITLIVDGRPYRGKLEDVSIGGAKLRMADSVPAAGPAADPASVDVRLEHGVAGIRSEEHTSELQSLMRISYAVFCLQKK